MIDGKKYSAPFWAPFVLVGVEVRRARELAAD
jgi:hypothetical protein